MKPQLLTAILVAATATGLAFAQDAKKEGKKGEKGMAKSVNVRIHAQNKSGESGTAKLTPEGADKTRVEVSLKGAPSGTPQPAHIHEGTCKKLDPKPKYGLENVVDGKSSTIVPVGIDAVRGMAINVHKSAQDLKTYVACGDIGKGGGAMKKSGGKMEKKEK
jgi:hypothetical protein